MKNQFVLLLLFVLMSTVAHAQKRTFLRIYSMAGNKFQKGYFASTTDNTLFIYKNDDTLKIPAVDIGYIKTKRSAGHDMLIGALIGIIPATVIGLASGEPNNGDDIFNFTPAEGALAGFTIGGIVGTAGGAINAGVKKTTTFTIDGDLNTWALQRKKIDLLPAGR
jgi:hypothetical protein